MTNDTQTSNSNYTIWKNICDQWVAKQPIKKLLEIQNLKSQIQNGISVN